MYYNIIWLIITGSSSPWPYLLITSQKYTYSKAHTLRKIIDLNNLPENFVWKIEHSLFSHDKHRVSAVFFSVPNIYGILQYLRFRIIFIGFKHERVSNVTFVGAPPLAITGASPSDDQTRISTQMCIKKNKNDNKDTKFL